MAHEDWTHHNGTNALDLLSERESSQINKLPVRADLLADDEYLAHANATVRRRGGRPLRPQVVELDHLLERRPVRRRERDREEARDEPGPRRGLPPQGGIALPLLGLERIGGVVNRLPE